uniref:Cholesterol side-chain cleavage enzyme, mitochondrial n=1 Tax=Saccoglossus kowalevskii TaxID=10224 RepID=A0ABM0LVN8_SACKO|nr:PREDICTED: sterol 26-hydroxylase, mitochondrial-like [Saccoglossus kowalevskii]
MRNHCRVSLVQASTTVKASENHDHKQLKPFKEIPGEGSSSFVSGVLYAVKGWRSGSASRQPWPAYDKWENKYGTLYKRVFGKTVSVFITDANDIEKVFRSGGSTPIRFEHTFFDILSAWRFYKQTKGLPLGTLTADVDFWHRQRKQLSRKMLRPKEVANYTDEANAIVTEFMQALYQKRNKRNFVDKFEDLTFLWSLEFIITVLFSKKLHLLTGTVDPDAKKVIDGVDDIFKTTAELFKFLVKYHAMVNTKVWQIHSNAWDAIFDFEKKIISEKEEELKLAVERGDEMESVDIDLITQLLTNNNLSKEEIYSVLSEVLLGSIDTTSNTLHWALYLVANNPSVQDRLYEEVSSVVPEGEVPSNKHLSQMPYMKSVVKETLRLYPAIPYINRTMREDIALQGYHIPAGTPLLLLLYKTSRNDKYFKDPLQFKPERWLAKETNVTFASMPFGFGPRMCIGRRLAELQLHLVLPRISRHFILESTTEVQHKMELTIKPDRDLNLKFIDRRTI